MDYYSVKRKLIKTQIQHLGAMGVSGDDCFSGLIFLI